MKNNALYTKYRPTKFSEVVGQKFIVQTLKNSIIYNKMSHSYIFCGTRGIGKTTIAKLYAKAINCLHNDNGDVCNNCENCNSFNNSPDIIELDAATNNGVDDVRRIVENCQYMPTQLKKKVFIIDEAHMLTNAAWNAILKTLEDCPDYVVFIFATTEFNKIPETVISRCQYFQFEKFSDKQISDLLVNICLKEKIKITLEAISEIVAVSCGAARDSLTILEQMVNLTNNNIQSNDVRTFFGLINTNKKIYFINSILAKKTDKVLEQLDYFNHNGINPSILIDELIYILIDAIVYLQTKDIKLLKRLNNTNINLINIEEKLLFKIIGIFQEQYMNIKNNNDPFLYFKLMTIRCMELVDKQTIDKANISLSKTPVTYKPIVPKITKPTPPPIEKKVPQIKASLPPLPLVNNITPKPTPPIAAPKIDQQFVQTRVEQKKYEPSPIKQQASAIPILNDIISQDKKPKTTSITKLIRQINEYDVPTKEPTPPKKEVIEELTTPPIPTMIDIGTSIQTNDNSQAPEPINNVGLYNHENADNELLSDEAVDKDIPLSVPTTKIEEDNSFDSNDNVDHIEEIDDKDMFSFNEVKFTELEDNDEKLEASNNIEDSSFNDDVELKSPITKSINTAQVNIEPSPIEENNDEQVSPLSDFMKDDQEDETNTKPVFTTLKTLPIIEEDNIDANYDNAKNNLIKNDPQYFDKQDIILRIAYNHKKEYKEKIEEIIAELKLLDNKPILNDLTKISQVLLACNEGVIVVFKDRALVDYFNIISFQEDFIYEFSKLAKHKMYVVACSYDDSKKLVEKLISEKKAGKLTNMIPPDPKLLPDKEEMTPDKLASDYGI